MLFLSALAGCAAATPPHEGVVVPPGFHAVAHTQHIDAPPDHVWQVLSRVGQVHVFSPLVFDSWTTSDAEQGVGATRHCDLGDSGEVDEIVTEWRQGEGFTIEVTEGLPGVLQDLRVRYDLAPDGDGTAITQTMLIDFRGPLAGLMARAAQGSLRRSIEEVLDGLREVVEAQEASPTHHHVRFDAPVASATLQLLPEQVHGEGLPTPPQVLSLVAGDPQDPLEGVVIEGHARSGHAPSEDPSGRLYLVEIAAFGPGGADAWERYQRRAAPLLAACGHRIEHTLDVTDHAGLSLEPDVVQVSSYTTPSGPSCVEQHPDHASLEAAYPDVVSAAIWIVGSARLKR